ncbi:MAG: beta-ureidopropionase / N-carbamoyl-L-amino-acid hydrolase [Gaiellales bacterium]|nr:beta-ureidopropionase / N-carbamoyl-L-amino-acid hydrolase [Gaiellales bacterium]
MIDAGLYRRLFAELAEIGREPGGWNRMAWGPGEDAAREWFRSTAAGLGLDVLQDPAGNLWAIEPGGEQGPFDAAGSHLDSVADGGAFDGALGVVAGFVAVEAARRSGGAARPLAVGAMVDEEGPRFGAAIFGSRALGGELEIEEILARTDPEGNVLRDVAALRGVTAETVRSAPAFLPRVASWIEVHVEQGRRLVDVPAPLGVASSLAARERWRCTLRGVSDHAGTAAMAGRRDALVPAARAVLAAHELARAEPGAVATVGRISALPGSTNQVPGEARLSLDVRAPAQGALARVREGVLAAVHAPGVEAEWLCESADPGSEFDGDLRQALHAAARAEALEVIDLAAYAGHDAGVLARHLPAAMLFVRNPTGISHNPAETASEEDCLAACAVLARVLAGSR